MKFNENAVTTDTTLFGFHYATEEDLKFFNRTLLACLHEDTIKLVALVKSG